MSNAFLLSLAENIVAADVARTELLAEAGTEAIFAGFDRADAGTLASRAAGARDFRPMATEHEALAWAELSDAERDALLAEAARNLFTF